MNVLRDEIQVRSMRMFGNLLPGEAAAGIGLHQCFEPALIALARPTETFTDRRTVTVAGVTMELVHAPGEPDDQLFVGRWRKARWRRCPEPGLVPAVTASTRCVPG